MCQLPDAVDITDRPQAVARAQARVDSDPARGGFDADGFQSESIDARTPASGDEQPVPPPLAAVREFGGKGVALARRARRANAARELHAVLAQGIGECLPEWAGLAG